MKAPAKTTEHLRTAVEHMLNDQGIEITNAETSPLPVHFDNGTAINWQRVNRFLGTLDDKTLETLCIGEHEEMCAIAKKHGVEGKYAHRALDTLFEQLGT